MKKLIYILIMFSMSFASCSDFLEETSQDLIVPKTVGDFREFLFGEAYFRDEGYIHTWLDVMTDDAVENLKGSRWGIASDVRPKGFGYYTWQQNPEEAITGGLNHDIAWEKYYHSILICNVVLDAMSDMEGSKAEKEDLSAEAYAQRAFCYYMLVNLYGEPYNPDTAESDLGVPLNDVVGMEDRNFTRESVATIYRQIESDLKKAMDGFKSSNIKKNQFRWNLPAVYLLASRVSLYQKKYDETIEYANAVIATHPELYDLSLILKEDDYFLTKKNPEILFTYGYYHVPFYAAFAKANYKASDELVNLIRSNDWRLEKFFLYKSSAYISNKNQETSKTSVYGYALRSAEAYLNRAEAYAEKGEIDKALEDLNTIHATRLKVYTDVQAASQEEAIKLVRDERRKELCFEQQRWFDLRRWDRPSITHLFTPDLKKKDVVQKYVLEQNDEAYTLPIPQSVMDSDPKLENIVRPVREDLNKPAEN